MKFLELNAPDVKTVKMGALPACGQQVELQRSMYCEANKENVYFKNIL